ncbi:riboflavin synthase [Candidatus Omnitrophota bacterium]
MFSGIVEEIGVVSGISGKAPAGRLDIISRRISKDAKTGDSVSVNGVCLTLVKKKGNIMSFDVIGATGGVTGLGRVRRGSEVNLESSLKTGDPVGGHFVTGHIDYAGKIERITRKGAAASAEITVPREKSMLLVDKGSVAVDGISLTVSGVKKASFVVNIIPHTLSATTLGKKKAGDNVNIELDQIGKYVFKMREKAASGGITEDTLRRKGYI